MDADIEQIWFKNVGIFSLLNANIDTNSRTDKELVDSLTPGTLSDWEEQCEEEIDAFTHILVGLHQKSVP